RRFDGPLFVASGNHDRHSRQRFGPEGDAREAADCRQIRQELEQNHAVEDERRDEQKVYSGQFRKIAERALSPRGEGTLSHSPAVAARSKNPCLPPRSAFSRTASPAARNGTNSRV